MPGYPKLIQDIWGIRGPIDAAFTRINCQGKTYPHVQAYTDIYHNNWEELFNMLFRGIPNHHGGHRFINKDWIGIKAPVDAVMTGRLYITPRPLAAPLSPPLPPLRDRNDGRRQPWDQQNRHQSYWGAGTEMAMGQAFAEKWMDMEKGFTEREMDLGRNLAERGMAIEGVFGGWDMRRTDARDEDRDRDRRRDDQDRRRDEQDRRRDGYNYNSRFNADESAYWEFVNKGQPVQSVYFFKGDKYYRVDLKTKKVDPASPPYPRSIGKYWLGCPEKHLGAEKK
ncbi:unnamed protein product [Coregonus sp. 'balchen']|nr:unnamed protein product [Coregonus sp. 'balchen']